MFRRITVFVLTVLLCASPVLAAHLDTAQPETPAEITVDPRQQAIADYWNSLTPEATTVFTTLPSAGAPYAIGELDSTYLNDGLRLLKDGTVEGVQAQIDALRAALQAHLESRKMRFCDIDGFVELLSRYRAITLGQQEKHLEVYRRVRTMPGMPDSPELQ